MLKIFIVLVFLAPGMTQPEVKRNEVESYQVCVDEIAKIKEKAEFLNGTGKEFFVMAGCEFKSEKSDPA